MEPFGIIGWVVAGMLFLTMNSFIGTLRQNMRERNALRDALNRHEKDAHHMKADLQKARNARQVAEKLRIEEGHCLSIILKSVVRWESHRCWAIPDDTLTMNDEGDRARRILEGAD